MSKKQKDKAEQTWSVPPFLLYTNSRLIFAYKYVILKKNAYQESDYVFTTDTGKHLSPGWVTKRFHEILRECGLPKMRFHDLRHSTCCILYEEGMGIKELQQWMRHAKLEMTADVYLHASKKREEALATELRNLFSQPLDKQQITQKTSTVGIA